MNFYVSLSSRFWGIFKIYLFFKLGASLVTQLVKNLPAMPETWVWSLGWEDPLEKGKATHSSVLAWRIPWTCITHGVAKSQTWLSDFHFHFQNLKEESFSLQCPSKLPCWQSLVSSHLVNKKLFTGRSSNITNQGKQHEFGAEKQQISTSTKKYVKRTAIS